MDDVNIKNYLLNPNTTLLSEFVLIVYNITYFKSNYYNIYMPRPRKAEKDKKIMVPITLDKNITFT